MDRKFSFVYKNDLNKKLAQVKKNTKKKQEAPPVPVHGRTAYLTFDDGPSPNTAAVLDILKRYNVKRGCG